MPRRRHGFRMSCRRTSKFRQLANGLSLQTPPAPLRRPGEAKRRAGIVKSQALQSITIPDKASHFRDDRAAIRWRVGQTLLVAASGMRRPLMGAVEPAPVRNAYSGLRRALASAACIGFFLLPFAGLSLAGRRCPAPKPAACPSSRPCSRSSRACVRYRRCCADRELSRLRQFHRPCCERRRQHRLPGVRSRSRARKDHPLPGWCARRPTFRPTPRRQPAAHSESRSPRHYNQPRKRSLSSCRLRHHSFSEARYAW